MRQRWGLPRSYLWVALLAAAAVATMFFLWPRRAVTLANFQRIQLGMSQADLCSLLGQPEYDTVELGLVRGPETYSLNFHESEKERLRRGFRDYRRQQWTSSEIMIIVISDPDGSVVCRYSGDGQRPGWLDVLIRISRSLVTTIRNAFGT
jgi:hypothetical protein